MTREFLPAFRVFWRSLLQHNSRKLFGDVIVQTNEWFEELAEEGFYQRPLVNRYHGWPVIEPRFLPCYGKLEVLECCEYDRILVLDSDMICTGSLAEIFNSQATFLGVGSLQDSQPRRFNGGLWSARRPVIGNRRAVDQLRFQTHRFFDKSEQSALLVYLNMVAIEPALFPYRFNLQIGFAEYLDLRTIYQAESHNCRILHFTGPAKPWLDKPPLMGWRERFRPLWERAERGEKLTSADVMEVSIK